MTTYDLTSEETASLMMALRRSRGERGYTEAEAKTLLYHVELSKTECAYLQAVFTGQCGVDVLDNRHIYFKPLQQPSHTATRPVEENR